VVQRQPARGDGPDPSVFERQYVRWADAVLRYLVHLVGPGPAAEDLFQESWEHALRHWDQLRDMERFGPWVYRIARNLAFNYKRQFNRQGQVWIMSDLAAPGDDPPEALLTGAPDPAPNPGGQALASQRREMLLEAMRRLDLQTQEMLQLRYFEQFTLAEVAMVLDVPLGTVCAKVHRALRTIQQHLSRQGIHGLDQV
jgi:RNA polymerase sigma-70 factor (ECF subfamily)